MNTLLQQLAEIDPGVSAGQAAEFRTVSLAIAQRLHGDPTSLPLSLNDWWQWLDDEGYDRDIFGPILGRICSARMDDSAFHHLLGFLQANADLTEGIPTLHQYVHALHPELEQQLDNLLAVAHEEETQMNNVAGGVSKKEKIWIPIVAIGTPLTIGLIIWRVKRNGEVPDPFGENKENHVRWNKALNELGKNHEEVFYDNEKKVWILPKATADNLKREVVVSTGKKAQLEEYKIEDMMHSMVQRADVDGKRIAIKDINNDKLNGLATFDEAGEYKQFYQENREYFNFEAYAKEKFQKDVKMVMIKKGINEKEAMTNEIKKSLSNFIDEARGEHQLDTYEESVYKLVKNDITKSSADLAANLYNNSDEIKSFGEKRAITEIISKDVKTLSNSPIQKLIEFFTDEEQFLTTSGKDFLKKELDQKLNAEKSLLKNEVIIKIDEVKPKANNIVRREESKLLIKTEDELKDAEKVFVRTEEDAKKF